MIKKTWNKVPVFLKAVMILIFGGIIFSNIPIDLRIKTMLLIIIFIITRCTVFKNKDPERKTNVLKCVTLYSIPYLVAFIGYIIYLVIQFRNNSDNFEIMALLEGVSYEWFTFNFLVYGLICNLCVGFSEEFLFRYLPMEYAIKKGKKLKLYHFMILGLLFGLGHFLHLRSMEDLSLVLPQVIFATIMGISFCMLYYYGGRSYVLVSVLHGVSDFLVTLSWNFQEHQKIGNTIYGNWTIPAIIDITALLWLLIFAVLMKRKVSFDQFIVSELTLNDDAGSLEMNNSVCDKCVADMDASKITVKNSEIETLDIDADAAKVKIEFK